MIVSTMTANEVFEVMERDTERLAAWASYREKELMRELRKSRRETVAQSYDYHTDNADYVIILRCNRKGYISRLRFAFIQETLEYVTIATQGGRKGALSYSTHLLRRYAERVLHDTTLPIRKILLKLTQNDVTACLYADDDYYVSGSEMGICLGKYDNQRTILVYRTFVSIDMLKETQLSAWEKVSDFVKKVAELKKRYGLYSHQCQAALKQCPMDMHLSIDEAQSIYASFFDKNDKGENLQDEGS